MKNSVNRQTFLIFAICVYSRDKITNMPKNQDNMKFVGRTGAVVSIGTRDQGIPCSGPDLGTVCCGLEQVTYTHCLVLVKPRKPWTDDSDWLIDS